MRITGRELRQIIKEELRRVLREEVEKVTITVGSPDIKSSDVGKVFEGTVSFNSYGFPVEFTGAGRTFEISVPPDFQARAQDKSKSYPGSTATVKGSNTIKIAYS